METTRDLGRIEPWEESLQRSLARRGKRTRTSPDLYRLRPDRDLSAVDIFEESAAYSRARRQSAKRRPGVPIPVIGVGGVSAAALLAVTTLPSVLGGSSRPRHQQLAYAPAHHRLRSLNSPQPRPVQPARPRPHPRAVTTTAVAAQTVAQVAPAAPRRTPAPVEPKPSRPTVHRTVHIAPVHPSKPAVPQQTVGGPLKRPHKSPPVHNPVAPAKPKPARHAPPPKRAPHHPAPHKSPPPPPNGYVDPLAHAHVTPERIDQGVDYAGTGTLTSLGRARITHVGTSDTGWPGAFIEYRLLNGPDAGRYVYYAEGVRPASGISVGRTVRAGQAVAHLIPGWSTGIEIGWGAGVGTETYAHEHGEYTYPTAAGKSFSALIASLGGPPGIP